MDTKELIRSRSEMAVIGGAYDDRPEWLRTMPHAFEPYYLFLYLLARDMRPSVSLEIGTYLGTSACHLAAGNRDAVVATIDIERNCKDLIHRIAVEQDLRNLAAITARSTEYVSDGDINLLFIDGNHTYDDAHGEYLRFRKSVAPGGVILFDDISLNDEMRRMWAEVEEPKVELPRLHYTGFGAAFR